MERPRSARGRLRPASVQSRADASDGSAFGTLDLGLPLARTLGGREPGVAYDRHFLDPRAHAAVILSGAKIPGDRGYVFTGRSPPLLATQGTADTINPPQFTYAFFRAARRPRFALVA
jgi:hypothetical protein